MRNFWKIGPTCTYGKDTTYQYWACLYTFILYGFAQINDDDDDDDYEFS